MTPTYTLYHGDCLIEMDAIADNSINAIIADWPYNSTENVWDSLIPLEPLWAKCKRVLKRSGVIVLTSTQPFTSMLVMSNHDWFKWEDVWRKSNVTGFLNCKVMPLRQHENILVFGNGKVTYNPQLEMKPAKDIRPSRQSSVGTPCYGQYESEAESTIPLEMSYPRSIINFNTTYHEREAGLHPTQKPIGLLSYLIKTYTDKGDTILDNTMGSGSTGEAALRTGRRFIGIELYPIPTQPIGDKNPDYFGIAQRRLDNVARELRGEWKPMADNGKGLEDLPMFAGSLT